MKKNNILLIIVGLMLTLSLVSAEYRIYDNKEDFEADKWAICESATDGCNTYFMVDGKVAWWTKMYCEDAKVEWNCIKYKENSISTMSITTTAMPVTISIDNKLSTNDLNHYNTIKNRLESKYQKRVNNVVSTYKFKLEKYNSIQKERVNKKVVDLLELEIFKLISKYPQDIALSENVNNIYMTLQLFKLELMQLEF